MRSAQTISAKVTVRFVILLTCMLLSAAVYGQQDGGEKKYTLFEQVRLILAAESQVFTPEQIESYMDLQKIHEARRINQYLRWRDVKDGQVTYPNTSAILNLRSELQQVTGKPAEAIDVYRLLLLKMVHEYEFSRRGLNVDYVRKTISSTTGKEVSFLSPKEIHDILVNGLPRGPRPRISPDDPTASLSIVKAVMNVASAATRCFASTEETLNLMEKAFGAQQELRQALPIEIPVRTSPTILNGKTYDSYQRVSLQNAIELALDYETAYEQELSEYKDNHVRAAAIHKGLRNLNFVSLFSMYPSIHIIEDILEARDRLYGRRQTNGGVDRARVLKVALFRIIERRAYIWEGFEKDKVSTEEMGRRMVESLKGNCVVMKGDRALSPVIAQVIWTEISAQDGDIAVEDQIKLVERAVVAQDVEEARIAAFRIAHPTHEQQVDSIWYTEKELRGRGNPRKLTFNNLEKVVTAIWKRLHEIDGVRLSKGRVRQILMFRQLMWVERGRKGDVRDIRADQWKARLEREDILWATEHIRKNSPDNPTVSLVIDLLELEEMIGPEVEPKFEKRVEEVLAEESGSSFKGRTRLSKEGALLMPSAKKQVEITLSVERAAIKKNKVGPGNKAEPKRKVIASIIKEQYGASISPFKILQILKIRDGLVGVKDGLESHTIDIDIEEAARLLEKRYVRLARRKFLQFSRNPSARGVFSWLHNRYYIDRHNTTLTEETIYPLLHTIPTLSFYERVDVTLSAAERVDRERLAEGTSEEAKFEAMRKLLSEGSYPLTRPNDPLFSDEEMKRILDAREVLRGKSTGSSQTIELIDVVKKLREGETTESGRPKGLRPPPTGILPGQLQVFFDNPVVQARVDALMEFSVRLAKSNAGSVSRILVAEQLKNLFFMFADLNPKMLVEGITGLVNHPIYSVLGVEGFLAAEGGTKLLLNGMLNIQRFPRLLPFLHFVKAELPMAVAMTIMEVVGVALHTKHAVMLADQGTELERADFSTWLMIHAMLFAKTFKAAATDSKVLLHGGRKFLQFFAAAKFYTWGTFWTRAHWRTLFVRGKATRRAVYARTGQWGAIVADAAVVFTIEEVIDRAVDAYGTYKTEQAYRQQLVDARALYKEVILDPDATEEEKELADDVLDFSLSMSLLYLNQDLREGSHVEAIKQQQIHKRFDAEIAKIKEGEPNRFSATYDVGYAGKRIRSLEGRIEERYMLLGDGRYMINQQVVFEKPEEQGASSYWGSPSYTVSKPFRPEKSIVTAEELAIYQQERIAKMEAQRNMTIETMHVTMKTEAMQKAQPITERSKALIQEQIDWLIENIL